MSNDLVTRIEKAQKQLAGMRAFHRKYLDRRITQRIHTRVDDEMEGHQVQIGDCLDLMEAIKAILRSEEGQQ